MSKKLIAVASAAALALAALVGAPASAATFGVVVAEKVGGTGSASDAFTVNVATSNVLRGETVTTDTTAVKFTVTPTSSTSTISVTSTGGVKLISSADEALSKAATYGATSLTGIGATYDFYAVNQSTTAGTVTVVEGGNTYVAYVKGVSAKGYTITVTGAATASVGGSYKMTATVKDMFNNPTSGLSASSFTVTGAGSADASITETAVETGTGTGVYTLSAPTGTFDTSGPGLITVTLAAAAVYDENAVAFGDITSAATVVVNSADSATALAAAQSQITALQASVAALTADYNALAKKYNKLVKKSKRVALK
jgi:hypothetical protein